MLLELLSVRKVFVALRMNIYLRPMIKKVPKEAVPLEGMVKYQYLVWRLQLFVENELRSVHMFAQQQNEC
jgi:hypothetical protein